MAPSGLSDDGPADPKKTVRKKKSVPGYYMIQVIKNILEILLL